MIPDVPPWAWKTLAIAFVLFLLTSWLWILARSVGEDERR